MLLAVSGAVVLVGTVIAGASWTLNRQSAQLATTRPTVAGNGAVMSWNLHYGVSPAGSVDLEATARTIDAQNPDAVLLQEVSRGWVLGGGVDMATWLSDRLGRQFVFAPAADRRFGNVIMSRADPQDVVIHRLPYGGGPQDRSAVSARVLIGTRMVGVTSVHLQQLAVNTPTRLREIQSLLAMVGDAPGSATIIGGDFNATPGRSEIGLMTGAGFVSAIDTVGDPAAVTSPTDDPTRRIDWIFGRAIAFTTAKVLVDARTSDHLPLTVTAKP
jgi:endonuclease/exonuclease/phosphatase family metal-dependent hydrolase